MPRKLRYSLNGGLTWTVVEADLPYNISGATATNNVVVEPIGVAVSSAATITTPPVTVPNAGDLRLVGNGIFRSNGQEIIARGPEITIDDLNGRLADIDAIAATGANSMRMLLCLDAVLGLTPAIFETLLARCAYHNMIVWVSFYIFNDAANYLIAPALGGGNFYNLGGGSRQQPAACYLAVWQRQWAKDLMNNHRSHVIVDAAQEYIGPDSDTATQQAAWAASAKTAIQFFRAQGYTQPLALMANFQGRDLSGIVRLGEEIRQVDTVRVNGQPQVLFGWQAYWGTVDNWYPNSQGELLLGPGQSISAVQAMQQFVATSAFPIQCGFDAYEGDTNTFWQAQIDAAAPLGISWLWWSWQRGENRVEAPVGGLTTSNYVIGNVNGFAGAVG